MPRPSKFTDEARRKILEGLRAGFTYSAAAGAAGVHPSQVTRWRGQNASFANECGIAEAQAEARFTVVITKAAQDGDAHLALQWLKRRRRDEWGDSVNLSLDREIAELMAKLAGTGQEETQG